MRSLGNRTGKGTRIASENLSLTPETIGIIRREIGYRRGHKAVKEASANASTKERAKASNLRKQRKELQVLFFEGKATKADSAKAKPIHTATVEAEKEARLASKPFTTVSRRISTLHTAYQASMDARVESETGEIEPLTTISPDDEEVLTSILKERGEASAAKAKANKDSE